MHLEGKTVLRENIYRLKGKNRLRKLYVEDLVTFIGIDRSTFIRKLNINEKLLMLMKLVR